MSEHSDRYDKIAAAFTARVDAVPDAAWDNSAPCEGWVARDVIRHLVEWVPALFFGTWGIAHSPSATVDEDPVVAWRDLDAAIRAVLADRPVAESTRNTQMGEASFEQTLDMICTSDVLLHTWDLARATGLDESLDADEVHRLFVAMEPMDEAMRGSGHFGPRVDVPDDADEQTKLIAFTGRHP